MRMSADRRMPAEPARAHSTQRLSGRVELQLCLRARGLALAVDRRVACDVVAWAVVRRLPGAIAYRIAIDGNDEAPRKRRRFRLTLTPPTATAREVQGADRPLPHRRAGHDWFPLASRSAWADDFTREWEAVRSLVDGARVVATVTRANG